MTYRCIVAYLLLAFTLSGMAQKRAAIKLYEQAQQTRDMHKAITLYQAAIAKDSSYINAYSTLANLYYTSNRNAEEVKILQAAIARSDKPTLKVRLARAAYLSGQYELAASTLLKVDHNSPVVEQLQANVNYALDALAQGSPYEVINMGKAVNTPYDDYWPYLSVDEQAITTTVLITKKDDNFISANEDLYQSQRTPQGWTKSKAISPIINSANNEGAQCLSADGKIMLFTACNRNTGIGACDIFMSYQQHGAWSSPKVLPEPINSRYWDGHPSLSADGRYLYFASDRMHGMGKRDIYRAEIDISQEDVTVKSIEHLGPTINSKEDEVSPFIHPDGKTLYFSSNGHIGLGRMDIYKTEIRPDFTAPIVNLGYPINTHNDEIGFIVNTLGDKAYYSSERDSSQKKDIYHFTLAPQLRPEATSYFKAIVYNAETKERLKSEVELRHLNNDSRYYYHSAIDEFIIPIRLEEDYAISIEKQGFLFYSSQFSAQEGSPSPLVKEIYLEPIKADARFDLHNILFEFNTAQLDTSFSSELHKALQIITENPQLYFCIEGHTDSVGSRSYNQILSEKRALAVRDYFIQQGISAERLSYQGYGSTQPISDIPAENRRTSLRIISPQGLKQ